MGLLIDSDVFIDYERGELNLKARLDDRPDDEPVFLSVVSASELLHGVWRANDENRQAERRQFVEALLERFPLLPVDPAVAREHARLWADLAARGQMIGVNDSWLAATALAHDLAFATGNEREFGRVEGLDLLAWRPPSV